VSDDDVTVIDVVDVSAGDDDGFRAALVPADPAMVSRWTPAAQASLRLVYVVPGGLSGISPKILFVMVQTVTTLTDSDPALCVMTGGLWLVSHGT
jgi:hypothetical protein